MNLISQDLWAPTVSQIQDLTVVQQCVYEVMFRNVDEFKKRVGKSGLV